MSNTTPTPTVDIVVPCYKYAHYLPGCVDSILSQRDVAVRVLIMDDQSPDNTPDVGQGIAARDARVTYRRNENNLGLIGTANRGVMDWAQSDYVVLLSADDLLTPGALARATQLMEANPTVGLVYGMALIINDDGAPLVTDDVLAPQTQVIDGLDVVKRFFSHGNDVPTPTAIMRTAIQHRIGGYNAMFPHTSDFDMWLRAAMVSKVGVVNAVQGLYRWHGANMSAAYNSGALSDRAELLRTLTAFTAANQAASPILSDLLSATKARLAREALEVAHAAFPTSPALARQALDFAVKACPESKTWRRLLTLRAKQVIGPRATALALGAMSRTPPPLDELTWKHGAQIGWWPEAAQG